MGSIRTLCAFIAFGLAAATAAHAPRARVHDGWTPPGYYRGKDGPIFDVLQTQEDIQLRRYTPGKWVMTNVTNSTFGDAYKEGAKRLDDFWNGGNQNGTHVDDTVPVLTLLYPTGAERTVTTTFTIEYFLPNELHATPPVPKSPELEVLDIPDQDVWVHAFGGYVQDKDAIEQAFDVMEKLKSSGVDVQETFVAIAVYDDPLRLVGRHNEVWVWPKGAPTTTPSVPMAMRKSWLAWLREQLTGLLGAKRQPQAYPAA